MFANGQMILNNSSWNILIQSTAHLPRCIALPFSSPLLPHGSIHIINKSCYIAPRWSGELKLDGGHAPVQFYWTVMEKPSHAGIIPLQLGLNQEAFPYLVQLLEAKWLFFLDMQAVFSL